MSNGDLFSKRFYISRFSSLSPPQKKEKEKERDLTLLLPRIQNASTVLLPSIPSSRPPIDPNLQINQSID